MIYELSEQGVTVFVTTHYLDEAEHCHNLGFIYNGNLIALGSPLNLKKEIMKGDLLEVECNDPFDAIEILKKEPYNFQASTFGSKIHIFVEEVQQAKNDITEILKENHFHIERIEHVPLSLEDLFVHLIEEDDKKRNEMG
ncbi:MAG: hypothetical protein A2Y23_07080 [Clostridiales bacterium GWB2_37_7]|nr:MAG: hypothetical protein A2Y23_07080 [Clostridiales bacterium GWB2_37_7]